MEWPDGYWLLRVIGCILCINALWMTFLAVHHPEKFGQICKAASGERQINGQCYPGGKRRSATCLVGTFIGYAVIFYIAFNWSLGFLPADWGKVDEDGKFLVLRDYLAGLLSLPAAYIVFSAIGFAGDRNANHKETQETLDRVKEDFTVARRKRSLAIDKFFGDQKRHEQEKMSLIRESILLREDLKRIRELCTPEILEEYDRKQRERASQPPPIFRQ